MNDKKKDRIAVLSRGGRIRTYDLHIPNVARYQATLHPDSLNNWECKNKVLVNISKCFSKNYTQIVCKTKLTKSNSQTSRLFFSLKKRQGRIAIRPHQLQFAPTIKNPLKLSLKGF